MGKYFTVAELINSETATKRKINNMLPKELLPNLLGLIENVLDPLREAYGKPIHVNSGYRCEALNTILKGAKTSEHLKAKAADIVGTPNTPYENKKLYSLAIKLNLPFRQLIDEYGFKWVHISYDKNDIKRQTLKIK